MVPPSAMRPRSYRPSGSDDSLMRSLPAAVSMRNALRSKTGRPFIVWNRSSNETTEAAATP